MANPEFFVPPIHLPDIPPDSDDEFVGIDVGGDSVCSQGVSVPEAFVPGRHGRIQDNLPDDSYSVDTLNFDVLNDEPYSPMQPIVETPTDVDDTSPNEESPGSDVVETVRYDGKLYRLGETFPIGIDDSFEAMPDQVVPKELYAMTEILDITRRAGAPLDLVDRIFKVVEREVKMGRLQVNRLPRTDWSLSKIKELFHCPTPVVSTVDVERSKVEISKGIQPKAPAFPVYDFVDQLRDLLNDEVFADIGNLVVDPDDRWAPYRRFRYSPSFVDDDSTTSSPSTDSRQDFVNWSFAQDGDWFQNIILEEDFNSEKDFVFGIQLNVDKTGASGDAFQRHSSEPLMFTLTLLTDQSKHKAHLWRPLGYLPLQDRKNGSSGRNVRNYHRVLDMMLAGLVEAQRKPPVVRLRLGDEYRFVRARVFLVNCICDGLANEALVGRVQNRTAGCPRLCRACHTATTDSSTPNNPCRFVSQYAMERLTVAALGPEPIADPPLGQNTSPFEWYMERKQGVTTATGMESANKLLRQRQKVCERILKEVFSSHVVDNAFFKVDMGPNPAGIFGATPTDLMHAFEEGVVPCLLAVIIDPLPASQKYILDEIASSLISGNNCRSSSTDKYPRFSFKGSFTSLTLLSADEKMGKLLLLYLVFLTKRGRKVLDDRCSYHFDENRQKNRDKFVGPQLEAACDDDDVSSASAEEVPPESRRTMKFSKDDFNPGNEQQIKFVKDEMKLMGLKFLTHWEESMAPNNWNRICRIIWDFRCGRAVEEGRTIVSKDKKDGMFLPDNGICDRRKELFSRPIFHRADHLAADLLASGAVSEIESSSNYGNVTEGPEE